MPRSFLTQLALGFVFLALLMRSPVLAAPASRPYQQWGMEAEWRAILWYQARPWGFERSLIDDPKFFLSQTGATDPVAELEAMASALMRDSTVSADSVTCRFPRRTQWLARKLKRADLEERIALCPKQVIDADSVDQVYIVFSSYFLESPASFFGHLFLRFAQDSEKETYNPILDPVLNFSAVHGDVGFLAYVAGGMLGWFPGIFEVLPMHFKVQQYNNFESRDLWEYRLNLSKDQIRSMLLSLHEVLPHYSNYYYLSRNCSLLLAKLIASVAPELDIGRRFSVWATPIGILKRTVERVGNPSQVTFRASNRTRYLNLYLALNQDQQALFDEILAAQAIDRVKFPSVKDEMAILDTLLEFIDFDNRLAGPDAPDSMRMLRQQALLRRAKLPAGRTLTFSPAPFDNPVLMRPEQSLAAGLLLQNDHQGALLVWQPTLKDLITVSPGFRPDVGMSMFRLQLAAQEKSLDLLRLDILEVENYQPGLPYKSFHNINIRLSYGRLDSLLIHPKGGEVDAAINQGISLAGATFYGELRSLTQLTPDDQFGSSVRFGPGAGVIREWSHLGLKFHAYFNRDFTVATGIPARNDARVMVSQRLASTLDGEASFRLLGDVQEVQVLLRGFF